MPAKEIIRIFIYKLFARIARDVTASTTCSTLRLFMQRKSIGHARRKQGAHGTRERSRICLPSPGNPGAVSSGEELPNKASTGVPTAAAKCMGPVSLVG